MLDWQSDWSSVFRFLSKRRLTQETTLCVTLKFSHWNAEQKLLYHHVFNGSSWTHCSTWFKTIDDPHFNTKKTSRWRDKSKVLRGMIKSAIRDIMSFLSCVGDLNKKKNNTKSELFTILLLEGQCDTLLKVGKLVLFC